MDRYYPSSKRCNVCGNINKELTLSVREWKCNSCATLNDRDINAAKNIKEEGLRILLSGTDSKNQDELLTLVGVMTPEAHSISYAVDG